jgi:hypothetical protein
MKRFEALMFSCRNIKHTRALAHVNVCLYALDVPRVIRRWVHNVFA